MNLLCFPWSGASDSAYRPLAAALPDLNVVPVRPAGDCVDTMADRIADSLPPGPCVFFGHSFGALLAYAVARRMPPSLLVVSGSRSPASPPPVLLHVLPDAELDARLGGLGGMRPSLLADNDFMARFRPRVRADLAVCEPYLADEPLSVPVSAWAGAQDWYASLWLVRGWRSYTTADFRLRVFEGSHFFINDIGRSAAALRADLAWAVAPARSAA